MCILRGAPVTFGARPKLRTARNAQANPLAVPAYSTVFMPRPLPHDASSRPHDDDDAPARPASGGAPATADADEVSLHEVFERLLHGRWTILLMFMAFVATATAVTAFQAPVYESSTLIRIEDDESGAAQLQNLMGLGGKKKVEDEVEVLKSRTIAEAVVMRLLAQGNARQFPVLRAHPDSTAPDIGELVERLQQEYLQVRPLGRDMSFVTVAVTSTSPAEAAFIANAYADTYLAFNRSASQQQSTASVRFLEDQAGRIDSTLRGVEQEYRDFATGERAVAPELEAAQIFEQASTLRQRQTELATRIAGNERELAAYEAELGRLSPGIARRIASIDDRVIEVTREDLARARASMEPYYARNPELRATPDRVLATLAPADRERISTQMRLIDNLDRELTTRSQQYVDQLVRQDGLALSAPTIPAAGQSSAEQLLRPLQEVSSRILAMRAELSGLRASLGIVNQNIGQTESALSRIPQQRVLLERLTRNMDMTQETYGQIVKRLNESKIARESQLGYASVIDPAVVAKTPISPRVPLNLMLGALLGLLSGIGLVFVGGAFDTRVRRPEDLRRMGLPLLSVIPDMQRVIARDFGGQDRITVDGHSYSTRLLALLNPASPVTEGYRRLRTNVQFADPDNPPRVILFTSALPGEGKSVTALNLAATLAQFGHRVAYVDADLRRPAGHVMMGLVSEPGVSDLLFGTTLPDFEVFATPADDLYVSPAGSKVANPAEVLASRRMGDLLAALRKEFRYVIVDSPPVMVVSDTLVLSTMVDGVVLVCATDETIRRNVAHSIESVREVGGHVLGVVLNRYDARQVGTYSYDYYYSEYAYSADPGAESAAASAGSGRSGTHLTRADAP